MSSSLKEKRIRLYEIVEAGAATDIVSRVYDFLSTGLLILNLIVSLLYTFEAWRIRCGGLLLLIEAITIAFFMIDYILRVISIKIRYPQLSEGAAIRKYVFSLTGIIDLLSFLPYYLPFFFPAGIVAFRMFRVIRIFRLFKLNAYFDSLNVITRVLASKKQPLLSSVFIILILMIASSLCMYSLEHDAQPEVFQNAFSGMWWSVASVLTIGYGDIYPITTMGKVFSIIIAFLGVGMVAIPTGIISAGFVEQYAALQQLGDFNARKELGFVKLEIHKNDAWNNMLIKNLHLPSAVLIAMIFRDGHTLIPAGDTRLKTDDLLLLCSQPLAKDQPIHLHQVTIGASHPWKNTLIADLDISRQTQIAIVRRKGTLLIPRDDLLIKQDDVLIIYTKVHFSDGIETVL